MRASWRNLRFTDEHALQIEQHGMRRLKEKNMKSIFVVALMIAANACLAATGQENQIGRFAAGPEKEATPLRSASFPHLVAGKGWSTSYYITNVDGGRSANFLLKLRTTEGRELSVPVSLSAELSGIGSQISGTLRPAETIVVEVSMPADQEAIYGWADLTSTTYFYGFSGYAIYKYRAPDQQEQSYLVPLDGKAHSSMMLMMDNRAGYTTSVAIANNSPYYASEIIVRVVNQDGTAGPKQLLTIAPMGQTAFAVHDMFPQVKDRVVGIEFEGQDNRAKITGFGVRISPDGQLRYLPGFTTD
ncbi:MAG: hypothetical protein ACKV2U_28415 [Bryobacteraceae bacterium]